MGNCVHEDVSSLKDVEAGVSNDIGDIEITTEKITVDLQSDLQKVLRCIPREIWNTQVTISRIKLAPSWVTRNKLKE